MYSASVQTSRSLPVPSQFAVDFRAAEYVIFPYNVLHVCIYVGVCVLDDFSVSLVHTVYTYIHVLQAVIHSVVSLHYHNLKMLQSLCAYMPSHLDDIETLCERFTHFADNNIYLYEFKYLILCILWDASSIMILFIFSNCICQRFL